MFQTLSKLLPPLDIQASRGLLYPPQGTALSLEGCRSCHNGVLVALSPDLICQCAQSKKPGCMPPPAWSPPQPPYLDAPLLL